MKLIHIYSNRVEVRSGPKLELQPFPTSLNLASLPRESSEDSYYLINAHSLVGPNDKAQNQSGVAVYRHLLRRFDGDQDKLKVIFYSPLSRELLAGLKPENYVLKLLPFIRCNYNSLFMAEVIDAIDEYKNCWPRFNNAAENLLCGWSLNGAKTINLHGRKPLVIDDEWKDWKTTYDHILSVRPKYFLEDIEDIKAEFRKLNSSDPNAFSHLPDGSLQEYNFIIQDLYLWEPHDTQQWKTDDLIKSISGLRLFEKIRQIEPAMPVVFHTTSTKFRIYEALHSLGADGQASKNIDPEASRSEKEDSYAQLANSLEFVSRPFADCWLRDFFGFLSDDGMLKASWLMNIGRAAMDVDGRERLSVLIQNLLLDYKNLFRVDTDRLEKWFDGKSLHPLALTVSAILVNAAKIGNLTTESNPELLLIDKLRDCAAHDQYYLLRRMDVLLILVLFEKALKESRPRIIDKPQGFPKISEFGGAANGTRRNHPVLYYAHYYRHWHSYIPAELKTVFEQRITTLFKDYVDRKWNDFDSAAKLKMIGAAPVLSPAKRNKAVFENSTCRLDVVL